MVIILQWIDLIWLPLAWLAPHKNQRLWAVLCVLCCMLMMRLMAELITSMGYPYGFLGLMTTDVYTRGLGVYSFFYMAYLLFAHFCPGRGDWVFLGTSMMVFFVSAVVYAIAVVF